MSKSYRERDRERGEREKKRMKEREREWVRERKRGKKKNVFTLFDKTASCTFHSSFFASHSWIVFAVKTVQVLFSIKTLLIQIMTLVLSPLCFFSGGALIRPLLPIIGVSGEKLEWAACLL